MSDVRGVVKKLSLGLVFAAGLTLTGCASNSGASTSPDDPYEATNRDIFEFNMKLDRNIARPTAQFYVDTVPEFARDGLHNILTNANEPVVFVNDVLQGDVDWAAQTLGRLVLNTGFGLGGAIDVASRLGIPNHDNDFGITLGRWGVGEGPYLMLPVLGPAPPRDLTGMVVDIFFDPTTYVSYRSSLYYTMGIGLVEVIDMRAQTLGQLEGIERTSVDFYATTRNLYLQSREADLNRGKPNVENLPNF
jgi:phospholipid-binding lipoprotein MlaA